jgi:NAD-dependent SIR2 family protein deacetylase
MISLDEAEKELSELLMKEKLCIFAGSGVSVDDPSGLPTWEGFIDVYKNICKDLCESSDFHDFDKIIDDVDNYRGRDIIGTATALKDIITKLAKLAKKKDKVRNLYNIKLADLFANKKCNDYHIAIAGTNYKYILTTNYDDLLYRASLNNNYKDMSDRCYSYKNIGKISSVIYNKDPAIIHMHGMYPNIFLEDFIIFTKEDYKRIKDKNPGFRTLMNSIFMNYSILFVGYGSSDPHLEDIIEDLNMTLNWQNTGSDYVLPCYYLLTLRKNASPIFDHIKNKNRTKVIPVDQFTDMLTLLKKLQEKYPRNK